MSDINPGIGTRAAYIGADVFDGTDLHHGRALIVQDGVVAGVCLPEDLPDATPSVALSGGIIAPGFVDLQVNGGGGLMFNDVPDVSCLKTMAQAHASLGATSILPTLITDQPAITRAAVSAVETAVRAGMAGIVGLHLEGPHLSQSRNGAHDPGLIRRMTDDDLTFLCDAAQRLPVLKITLAPENVTPEQMHTLVGAGAVLSLGHTDASFDTCRESAAAGASCVTHLFNAMRQLGNREPGVVGAALRLGSLSAGIIGDLIHVHPETILLALAAKQGPGQIFLVSDAMAAAGSDISSFTLNGRVISRRNGRLTLEDGTLAGADLDLATALGNLIGLGVPLTQVLAMATSVPAGIIRRSPALGHLRPGDAADFVHLDPSFHLSGVWRAGEFIKNT
jgi:N-acetylglucosamine-6-phosphate deacetylase